MLDETETPSIYNGIQRYEYHAYESVTGNNHNSSFEAKINIAQKDLVLHQLQSYIFFEGRSTKANGESYANADKVALVNNN